MMSCEEAAIICNKAQYKEATFGEKLKLKLHVLFCETCSKFTRKNTELTELCQKAKLKSLTQKDKSQMQKELESEF
tara:strand:- start:46078 stop:46305 length:228 start_codon:yes stop_codon:yes gene_type:complete